MKLEGNVQKGYEDTTWTKQSTMTASKTGSQDLAQPFSSKTENNVKQDSSQLPQDSLELSSAGKDASYDYARIMRIHNESKSKIPTREDSDYYWNARANNKDLDQSLYDADKADALRFVTKIQSILMKAVSGQNLTPEEQEMVDSDPALAQEMAKRKSERLDLNKTK